MADKTGIEWTDATCAKCGKPITGKGNRRFCSRLCYAGREGIIGGSARLTRRISWVQRTWYGQERDALALYDAKRVGAEIEAKAALGVLPKMGFSEIVNLAEISHGSPVDFLCLTSAGDKAFVEVTRKWQKRVVGKAGFAAAIGFPLFVVFVSPRDARWSIRVLVDPSARSVRVPIEWLRKIAAHYREPGLSDARAIERVAA